jgi:hypothetical protein
MSEDLPQPVFKPAYLAKRSNIPFLGRTRLMARIQQAASKLARTSRFPTLAAFFPQNLWPWLWSYLKSAFHGKHKPYPTYLTSGQTGVYSLRAADGGNIVKLSIVGDWGTGTKEAYAVAQNMLKFAPDYTIHLGDVYYVGEDVEVKENFLGAKASHYKPVFFPKGAVGTFAMLGNHEMYGGGAPYFGELLAYCSTGTGEKQKTSFFCLETAQWRIIALDTGYNSVGTPILGSIPLIKKIPIFGADCHLQDELITWLEGNVKPQQLKKPTLLLSHHQYFSAFATETFARPAKQLKAFFAGQDVVWIWGHEHRLAIYDVYSPDGNIRCYGRCLGNGGMPVETGAPNIKMAPLTFYDPRADYPVGDKLKAGWNGFLNLTIDGPTMTLDYRDLKNQQLFVESFVGSPGGAIRYSFEQPVPILVAPGKS